MSWAESIVFLSRDWFPVAACVAVLVILVSLWGYSRSRLAMRLKLTGVVLKTLGVLLLCFCLLEPQWVDKKAKPGANFVAVLADNSQGMEIRDAGSATSRAEDLTAILKPQPDDWQEALDDADWNKSAAATALGVKRTTLLDMIRRKNLDPDQPVPVLPRDAVRRPSSA